MSTVLVVTPLLIAGWPALAAVVSAAVSSLGFAVVQSQDSAALRRREQDRPARSRAEVEVEDSEILAGTEGTGETLVVERDGVRAEFRRDARGALRLCLEGDSYSKAQLQAIGETLIGRVTQQYAYHRVVTELKERQMPILGERVGEDQSITLRVRNA